MTVGDPIHSRRWRLASYRYRQEHPLCRFCLAAGLIVPAAVVDHIIPRRQAPELMWDESNWQSLCHPCHSMHKQRYEAQGFHDAIDASGWPIDPMHPANAGRGTASTRTPGGASAKSGAADCQAARIEAKEFLRIPDRETSSSSHPRWLRRSLIPVTVVCGAPGSGKSTFVRARAAANDLVICFDQIAEKITGQSRPDRDRMLVDKVLRHRNAMLGDLSHPTAKSKWRRAWLIVSEPEAKWRRWWRDKLSAQIVVLETPAEECKRRVAMDAFGGDMRTGAINEVIDDWWKKYTRASGEQYCGVDVTS